MSLAPGPVSLVRVNLSVGKEDQWNRSQVAFITRNRTGMHILNVVRVVVSHNVQRYFGAKGITMVHAQGSLDTLG